MNSITRNRILRIAGCAAIALAAVSLFGLVRAAGQGHDHVVFSTALANVPGKTLTAVVVDYTPGGKSPPHQHAGSVFAYVLSGAIRSENSATGPVKTYHAGEAFFEPPGSVHRVSENASQSEPASLLAIFVADDQARLTQPAK